MSLATITETLCLWQTSLFVGRCLLKMKIWLPVVVQTTQSAYSLSESMYVSHIPVFQWFEKLTLGMSKGRWKFARVRTWCHRRLTHLAYSTAPNDVKEILAKEQCIDGLASTEMRLCVKQARSLTRCVSRLWHHVLTLANFQRPFDGVLIVVFYASSSKYCLAFKGKFPNIPGVCTRKG
jgi:hypothetical protein